MFIMWWLRLTSLKLMQVNKLSSQAFDTQRKVRENMSPHEGVPVTVLMKQIQRDTRHPH